MQVLVAGQFYREVFQFSRLRGLFPGKDRGRPSLSLFLSRYFRFVYCYLKERGRD